MSCWDEKICRSYDIFRNSIEVQQVILEYNNMVKHTFCIGLSENIIIFCFTNHYHNGHVLYINCIIRRGGYKQYVVSPITSLCSIRKQIIWDWKCFFNSFVFSSYTENHFYLSLTFGWNTRRLQNKEFFENFISRLLLLLACLLHYNGVSLSNYNMASL